MPDPARQPGTGDLTMAGPANGSSPVAFILIGVYVLIATLHLA